MRIRSFLFIALCLVASACGGEDLVEGGLYSTPDEHGTYSVFKILKLDDDGVHVRVYSNQFASHPASVDESELYMVGMDRKPGQSFGVGHLPLSRGSFSTWKPRFIKTVPVKKEELAGYEEWKKGGGSYF